jgi:hypothetical protein
MYGRFVSLGNFATYEDAEQREEIERVRYKRETMMVDVNW